MENVGVKVEWMAKVVPGYAAWVTEIYFYKGFLNSQIEILFI